MRSFAYDFFPYLATFIAGSAAIVIIAAFAIAYAMPAITFTAHAASGIAQHNAPAYPIPSHKPGA